MFPSRWIDLRPALAPFASSQPLESPRRTVVHGVLCDTSYFIRWAKPNEALHPAAQHYRKFLVEGGHTLYVSTIALAEYAVRDAIANLPPGIFASFPSTSTMRSSQDRSPGQSSNLVEPCHHKSLSAR